MTVLRDLDHLPEEYRHGAVTIGNFDGVHCGHARIVERLLAMARSVSGPAVVFTFDPHPAWILRPDRAPPPLTWTARKASLLARLGIDAVVAFPTSEAFLKLGAREFFDRVVVDRLDVRAVVEGPNFFFGHDRSGTTETLARFCRQAGIALGIVEPVLAGGEVVSSSRIRGLIVEGRLEEAGRMLTEPYRIRGRVVRGAGRGRQLGYPTANLQAVDTVLPAVGIYAGRALADGRMWPAAISLGPNPTFDEEALKVEVHLIDYDGWLYDRDLEVDFLSRLRSVERYDSVEQLLRQMALDIAATREMAV